MLKSEVAGKAEGEKSRIRIRIIDSCCDKGQEKEKGKAAEPKFYICLGRNKWREVFDGWRNERGKGGRQPRDGDSDTHAAWTVDKHIGDTVLHGNIGVEEKGKVVEWSERDTEMSSGWKNESDFVTVEVVLQSTTFLWKLFRFYNNSFYLALTRNPIISFCLTYIFLFFLSNLHIFLESAELNKRLRELLIKELKSLMWFLVRLWAFYPICLSVCLSV